jgi:cyclic pyranopterin phosphate synthase
VSEDANELTHIDDAGRARMVDVAGKPETLRVARAGARVLMSTQTARLLADGGLPKGDALPVVRLAGIQAAKRTPELIPLCHQVRLTTVDVTVTVDVETGVAEVAAEAVAFDRTGVEMEAMTAVTVAALTLYDLCKAVQRDVVITDVRLLAKSGGRSGDWHAQS